MMLSSKALITLVLLGSSSASEELKVNVYDGPKECADEDKVVSGKNLAMHYTGTIDESSATGEKGKQFDSSRDRGETFDFVIGKGMVIQGWDKGLLGLCKGAKATIVIPPVRCSLSTFSLDQGVLCDFFNSSFESKNSFLYAFTTQEMGYGERGAGTDIPGGATVNFDVEVVDISDAPPEHNLFAEIDINADGKIDEDEVKAYFLKNGVDPVPEELWETEDKNGDRIITWEEFSGPKGSAPPGKGDEL